MSPGGPFQTIFQPDRHYWAGMPRPAGRFLFRTGPFYSSLHWSKLRLLVSMFCVFLFSKKPVPSHIRAVPTVGVSSIWLILSTVSLAAIAPWKHARQHFSNDYCLFGFVYRKADRILESEFEPSNRSGIENLTRPCLPTSVLIRMLLSSWRQFRANLQLPWRGILLTAP